MKKKQFIILQFVSLLFFLPVCMVNAATVKIPVIQPETATSFPTQVSIICITPDAVIHYTTDGTRPDENSPIYTNPLTITSSTILRARAFKPGMNPGYTAHAIYEMTAFSESNPFAILRTVTNNKTSSPVIHLDITPDESVLSYVLRLKLFESNTRYFSRIK
ncbi:conserved hypothetical protein, secreted, partial [Candidatus Magnetomorum sp. HK-1]